jgi:hypothetical protein
MVKEIKVKALMTAPRYENTWCRNQIEAVLKYMKIPFEVSLGVYYGQCMQMMMENAVAETDYLITIDGDTCFKPSQLQRLLNIIVQEKMDALAGMQLRRGSPAMLGAVLNAETNFCQWTGYPIKVDTAHFGLTILDSRKLEATAKPWFFCQPDSDGRWTESKIDSDVWFWLQWQKAGNSVYVDPDCRLGHVEEMVAIYDENYKPVHMYPKDWIKHDVDTTIEDVASKASGIAC